MAFDPGHEQGFPPSGKRRPDFLIDGWAGFFGRLVFVLSFLGLMVICFLSMTGLWKLF